MAKARAGLLLVVLLATACAAPDEDGGPLRPMPPHGYGPIVVEPGVAFSDGFEIVTLDGEQTAEITDIRLVDSSDELSLVDVLVAGAAREYGAIIQFEPQFPPADNPEFGPLTPARGAELQPNTDNPKGYELIFGLVVEDEGVFRRGGYEIDYTVAGEEFTRTYQAEIVICTPSFVGTDPACDS